MKGSSYPGHLSMASLQSSLWPAKVLTPRRGVSGFGGAAGTSSGSGFSHAVAVALGDHDVGVVE